MAPVRRVDGSESGAALILALGFVFAIGMVLVALVSLAGTNLINTSNLQDQRNVEFAADTVIDGAIQTLRHQPPPATCPTFPNPVSSAITVNGVAVEVQCQIAPPSSLDPFGRNVEFDACRAVPGETWNTCQSSALIRAQVTYDDLAPGCISFSPASCISYGNQMSIWNWVVRTANG